MMQASIKNAIEKDHNDGYEYTNMKNRIKKVPHYFQLLGYLNHMSKRLYTRMTVSLPLRIQRVVITMGLITYQNDV